MKYQFKGHFSLCSSSSIDIRAGDIHIHIHNHIYSRMPTATATLTVDWVSRTWHGAPTGRREAVGGGRGAGAKC